MARQVKVASTDAPDAPEDQSRGERKDREGKAGRRAYPANGQAPVEGHVQDNGRVDGPVLDGAGGGVEVVLSALVLVGSEALVYVPKDWGEGVGVRKRFKIRVRV